MKQIAFALLTLLASNAFADSTYCRDVQTGGMFDQPLGIRQHCVTLKDNGIMIDNASTFFGNPPLSLPYSIENDEVLVEKNGSVERAYVIVGETLVNDAGAILIRQ